MLRLKVLSTTQLRVGSNLQHITNHIFRVVWSRVTSRDPKSEGRDPKIFEANHLDICAKYTVDSN